MKDKTWTGDDEVSAFDDILSARVPSRGALRYMTVLAAAGNMLEHTPCILMAACCMSLLFVRLKLNPNNMRHVQQRLGGL